MLLSVEKALPLRRRSCNITVVWPCKGSTRRSSSVMPGDGTSDISSGVSSMQRRPIDFKYLYAEGKSAENRPHRKEDTGNGIRRVASFTFSPKGTEAKHNKRPELDLEPKKKSTFSRFTKTLSYIRNKMDAASTSALYPTKEEVRQWEQSFESLLNHK
uniref:RGS domain-containing protein n=1 Tax=Parascaris univalens TaxID=6257 RepID=A0A914ZNY7_PARUN